MLISMVNQSKHSSESNQSSKGSCRSFTELPIKLETYVCTYSKGKCVNVKCQTSPAEADSTTYKLTIPTFKNKNYKEWLEWIENVECVAIGQITTTGLAKYALAKRLHKDRALQTFKMPHIQKVAKQHKTTRQ